MGCQVSIKVFMIKILAFYDFIDYPDADRLVEMRDAVKETFIETGVRGTLILAHEGYNGMICGDEGEVDMWLPKVNAILGTELRPKISCYSERPFRKIDVKIKPEIVTLRHPVDIKLGHGTHVSPEKWNELISDPETFVLDTRNDYEYKTGTFRGAVNPDIEKFSELKEYAEKHLDPAVHKRIATFCTGGIRCEKAVPMLRAMGFDEVYQLDGGILKYLEDVPVDQQLWDGECYVFDERVTVDNRLNKGSIEDISFRKPPKSKV